MNELVDVKFLQSATQIAKGYPTLESRLRYKTLLDIVKAAKKRTPEISRAEIETQVALADAIDEGLESGEVRAERNEKGHPKFVLGNLPNTLIDGAEVPRWRKLREIPEDERVAYYQSTPKPSRNGLLRHWSSRCVDAEPVATTDFPIQDGTPLGVTDLADLPLGHFGCIYADPPWQYGNQGTRASTDNHYGTMSIPELCEMPVGELAAEDSHLHLWTTNAFIREAFDVIEAWGFEYRSMFIWAKPQMGIGNYWRVSHEIMLLGIRGNAKSFNDHSMKSWASVDRGKHSAKPDSIRHMVERASNGPYLELFGRKLVDGWTVFGNQISSEYQPSLAYQ